MVFTVFVMNVLCVVCVALFVAVDTARLVLFVFGVVTFELVVALFMTDVLNSVAPLMKESMSSAFALSAPISINCFKTANPIASAF